MFIWLLLNCIFKSVLSESFHQKVCWCFLKTLVFCSFGEPSLNPLVICGNVGLYAKYKKEARGEINRKKFKYVNTLTQSIWKDAKKASEKIFISIAYFFLQPFFPQPFFPDILTLWFPWQIKLKIEFFLHVTEFYSSWELFWWASFTYYSRRIARTFPTESLIRSKIQFSKDLKISFQKTGNGCAIYL